MGAERQDSGTPATSDIEGRVARWLGALLLETNGIEPPVDITVSHAAVDQNRRIVRCYQLAALPVPTSDLYKLTHDITETIAADAEELGGLQRYQIVARSRGQEVGSTTVRYAMDVMPSGIDSEPATARGLVAQSQRHSEGAVRMLVQGTGALLGSYQRRIADLEAHTERMQERWIEDMKVREQILTERAELSIAAEERRAENELRIAKEINEMERRKAMWTEGLAAVKFMLPMAAKYVFGKAEAGAADSSAEAEYLRTITDEQLQAMRGRVPPEELADLVAKVKAARAAAPTASAAAQQPAASAAPTATRGAIKPLVGDAKLGAIRLLWETLLPLVTERHLAGKPLMDPATDDLSLYQLVRRLAVSVDAGEVQMLMSNVSPATRDATLALLQLLNIELPGLASGAGGAS